MSYQIYFPPEVMALQAEIQYHPKLLEQLCKCDTRADMADKLGEVAAYCDVALEGMYDNDSLLKLCRILLGRLQTKRTGIILPASH